MCAFVLFSSSFLNCQLILFRNSLIIDSNRASNNYFIILQLSHTVRKIKGQSISFINYFVFKDFPQRFDLSKFFLLLFFLIFKQIFLSKMCLIMFGSVPYLGKTHSILTLEGPQIHPGPIKSQSQQKPKQSIFLTSCG